MLCKSIRAIFNNRKSKKLIAVKKYFVNNWNRIQHDIISSRDCNRKSRHGKCDHKGCESAPKDHLDVKFDIDSGGHVATSIFYNEGKWDMLNEHACSIYYVKMP